MKLLTLLSLIWIVVGCVPQYQLVKSNTNTLVANRLVLNSPVDLSAIRSGDTAFMTIDGPAIQEIVAVDGLSKGNILSAPTGSAETSAMPKFDPGTGLLGFVEFFEESLRTLGYYDLEVGAYDRVNFLDAQGLDIPFRYRAENGLPMRGLARLALVGEEGYIIFFTAAESYFFDRDIDDVRRILDTAVLKT